MGQRKMLITRDELRAFMSEQNYLSFISSIENKAILNEDYEEIDGPIFIQAEW